MNHVSVSEARDLQQKGHTYVDVRSTGEFNDGHPAGAVNVPIIEPDEDTGQPQQNPDFLRVMQATFSADAKLLVGCQAGGRSMRAAQMLEAAGFQDVSNVKGGFGGARDRMSGRVVDPGWFESDFPVETGQTAGAAYRDLVAKADAQPVIRRAFHAWERRLASVDTNRVIRPFEWGLEWLGVDAATADPHADVSAWSIKTMVDSDQFFATSPIGDYAREGDRVTFPSALVTPHPCNNVVHARLFPARRRGPGGRKVAVVVLPQWNADEQGHVGLCRLFASFGVTALRLSLPYHDARRPPDLERADFIVSPNVGRTAQVNRQAVLDARRAVDWLLAEGYERVGIMGTSLGSCLAMLTMAHDGRIAAGAFNHISPYFADVVWHGISTWHVRQGFEGHITLDQLRQCWMPISPRPFIDRVRGRPVCLIYARYDLTFPPTLSRSLVDEFRSRGIPHQVGVLPCGHYTTGKAPFKYLDGYYLTKFFVERL